MLMYLLPLLLALFGALVWWIVEESKAIDRSGRGRLSRLFLRFGTAIAFASWPFYFRGILTKASCFNTLVGGATVYARQGISIAIWTVLLLLCATAALFYREAVGDEQLDPANWRVVVVGSVGVFCLVIGMVLGKY